jgi:hypothetical protein
MNLFVDAPGLNPQTCGYKPNDLSTEPRLLLSSRPLRRRVGLERLSVCLKSFSDLFICTKSRRSSGRAGFAGTLFFGETQAPQKYKISVCMGASAEDVAHLGLVWSCTEERAFDVSAEYWSAGNKPFLRLCF